MPLSRTRPKLSVIGAGNVGATTAHLLALKGLGDVALVDINDGQAKGKALDIQQSLAVEGVDVTIKGGSAYDITIDSEIVVITAGSPRKPGMSREDLISINTKIVADCVQKVTSTSPNAILIVVTNPLDGMVHVARKVSRFPGERVFGMSGVLDTARYKAFLAEAIGCSVMNITGFVLGGHGDTMVPLPGFTFVEGVPVTQFLKPDVLNPIIDRTRNGGAEIVQLLQTGSAFYAPAASSVEMIDSILNDRKRILPTCCFLNGEYGLKDLPIGVPALLGQKGVHSIIEIELSPTEKALFQKSVDATKAVIAIVDKML